MTTNSEKPTPIISNHSPGTTSLPSPFESYTVTPSTLPKVVWQAAERLGASRAFVAVERHRLDGVHVHSLLRQYPHRDTPSQSLWKYLSKSFGRTSVQLPHDGMAAVAYCAKYVTKDHGLQGESFHYFGDADAWNLDGSTWEY